MACAHNATNIAHPTVLDHLLDNVIRQFVLVVKVEDGVVDLTVGHFQVHQHDGAILRAARINHRHLTRPGWFFVHGIYT